MLLDVNDDESKKEAKATVQKRRRRWWSLKAFLCLSNLFFRCFFFPFLQERKKLKKFDQFVNFILLINSSLKSLLLLFWIYVLIDDDDDENDFCDEYRSYNHE